MSTNTNTFLDRKERLKGEGKVELPLNVDTKKYLIGNIAYYDILVSAPFIVLSIILISIFKSYGVLTKNTFIPSLLPVLFIMAFQLIKHPIRKRNLSFLQYGVIWRIKFQRRNKVFIYKKGEIDMSDNKDQDIRKILGIKNVFSGCYETTDNRFVKVLEVSSLNLSLMSRNEKNTIFESYKTFLSELQFLKKLQISQIAQPVNLSKYMLNVEKETEGEKNLAKSLLSKSYLKYGDQIQKSKNMVSRKRYIIIDHPISNDREHSLREVERKALLVETNINNMLRGYSKLYAKPLLNDELLKLLYTCIDYNNSQALGGYIVSRAQNKSSISVGTNTAKDIIETYQKQLNENIL